MRTQLRPYPVSPIEVVTEVLHGIPVKDPYRWLEDRDLPRTQQWLGEQSNWARDYLEALPGRRQLRQRISELLSADEIDVPLKVRNRIFFLQRVPGSEQPVLRMRERLNGPDRTLLDPASHFESSAYSIGILSASEDARLLALSVRKGGEDFYGIRILDLERREFLPDSLPRGTCRGFVFGNDSSGFFYSHSLEGSRRDRAVYWHRFGTDPEADVQVFGAGEDPRNRLTLFGSATGSFLAIAVSRIGTTRVHDLYVQPADCLNPARLVLRGVEGKLLPRVSKNQLVCFLQSGYGNGRLIGLKLDASECSFNWRTMVPESHARIDDFVVCGGTLYVRSIENAECKVAMFDAAGQSLGLLPAPTGGTIRLFRCDPDGDLVFYRFSSFIEPPAIYCHSPQTRTNRLWWSQQIPMATRSFVVEKSVCRSGDATEIPMHLVRHQRWLKSDPRPALLTAYGGFANSITPEFSILGALLAERGCLFAVANVRGGGEFGEPWHFAAKRRNRQKAIDDFLAVSEWLTANGQASPGKLAIAGGSNGGLLVGAALTQRPDLYRAALCLGPLLDMIRYPLFDSARDWTEEFGSPDDPEDFRALLAYSPYHRVKGGTPYPAVLFVSGDADSRCNPMHVRKMTARLQAATTSGHPVVMDYRQAWGHAPVQPVETRIELLTDRVGFLCAQLEI